MTLLEVVGNVCASVCVLELGFVDLGLSVMGHNY